MGIIQIVAANQNSMLKDKIKASAEIADVLLSRRNKGEQIVFTNGCFDLLHIGHVRYLESAKALGTLLIVGINSDASVRSLDKGRDRPIVPETERCEVLAALGSVDFVVLFDESNPLSLIKLVQPDVLVKGGDWKPEDIIGREEVEAMGGMVCTIPLVPHVSTTTLIRRIRETQEREEDNPSFP